MISILQRYIAKTLFLATAMVTVVFVGVLFLILLLTELKNLGQGDYGIFQAIYYVVLRLPNELYQFSSILILLGSIVGLSILSTHRELAVMRVSGFSSARIVYSVLCAAFLLILLMGLLGEWFAPHFSYKAEIQKENSQNAGQAVVTAAGVWFHINNNFIHVERIIDRQLLYGVTRYQFNDQHQLQAAYFAKTLTLQNKTWQMNDMVRTLFYHDRTKSESYLQYPFDLKLNPNLLNVGLVDASDMSLVKLARFSHYLKQNGLQSNEYRYVFWQRIFKPFISLMMVFLAIPFMLSTFQSLTMGRRILTGILLGFAFFIINAMIGELSVLFQFPPVFAAFFPLFLFFLLGIFLSKRLIRF